MEIALLGGGVGILLIFLYIRKGKGINTRNIQYPISKN
jgi:hypothetical protein